MSLYDDVVITDFALNIANSSSTASSSTSNAGDGKSAGSALGKNDSQNDLANWNNSLKLLQFQVEAAKKRQLTLSANSNLKKEKHATNIAPVIDLTEKRKPQLQLKKDQDYIFTPFNTTTELRFNSLTGKVEKEESNSMYGGGNEEYDPMKPNDYEKLAYEAKKIKQLQEQEEEKKRQDRNKSDRDNRSKHHSSRSSSDERRRDRDRDRDRDREPNRRRRSSRDRDREKNRRRRSSSKSSGDERTSSKRKHDDDGRRSGEENSKRTNMMFAPPPSLIETTPNSNQPEEPKSTPTKNLFGGLFKAEKMMAKMGYKEGEGLGKNNQGMSIALQVEKTGMRSGRIIHEKNNPPEPSTPVLTPPVPSVPVVAKEAPSTAQVGIPADVMKNMSKVVLLRNMVAPGDVDDDLETETKEECQKYGEVNKVIIFEIPNQVAEEAVRIFVEFKTQPSAIKALTDLNGRFFGGRKVKATFYNLDKFNRLELGEPA